GADFQRLTCLRSSSELAPQPPDGTGLQPIVTGLEAAPISRNDSGKIITTYHLGQRLETSADCALGRNPLMRICSSTGNKLFYDGGQRSAIGLRSRRQIAHQLGVERAGLAAARMQAPVGIQVSVGNHELLL